MHNNTHHGKISSLVVAHRNPNQGSDAELDALSPHGSAVQITPLIAYLSTIYIVQQYSETDSEHHFRRDHLKIVDILNGFSTETSHQIWSGRSSRWWDMHSSLFHDLLISKIFISQFGASLFTCFSIERGGGVHIYWRWFASSGNLFKAFTSNKLPSHFWQSVNI